MQKNRNYNMVGMRIVVGITLLLVTSLETFAENSSDDFFQFKDLPVDNNHATDCKPWSSVEVQIVKNLLIDVYAKSPGIFVLSATSGKIFLFRKTSILVDTPYGDHASAMAQLHSISFSDSFFNGKTARIQLVHELVHTADHGCRLCYSAEWVRFANPLIGEVQRSVKETSPLKLSELEKKTRTLNKWPSLWSSTSLKEALAEYYATYLVDPDFACSHEFDSIATRLTHPNAQDVNWNILFNDGVDLFNKNLVSEALQKFKTCSQIDASPPMPYVYLSRCYWKMGDFENCIANSKNALKNFDFLGVGNNDNNKFHLLILYAQALQATSKFEESKKIIDEALKTRPNNPDSLRLRAVYEAKQKRFDDALDSLYSSLLLMRPNETKEDPEKLEKAVNLEHQGDLNSDLSKRMQFYDLALEDVQNKLPHSGKEKYALCLFAAKLCFKMKHFKSSESFCRWAVDLNSEDIEPKLLLFKISETTGSSNEIEKEFGVLWMELSQAWLTRRGFFNSWN